MKFTLITALALASTTLSAPTKRQEVNAEILPALLEKLPGLAAAVQGQQQQAGGMAPQVMPQVEPSVNATAPSIAARNKVVTKRDPQIDVAGILEKLPGVIGALKGSNSTAAPTPTPGAGAAPAGGLSGILEQLPGVIDALKDKEGVTGAAGAAPGAAGAATGGIMKN